MTESDNDGPGCFYVVFLICIVCFVTYAVERRFNDVERRLDALEHARSERTGA